LPHGRVGALRGGLFIHSIATLSSPANATPKHVHRSQVVLRCNIPCCAAFSQKGKAFASVWARICLACKRRTQASPSPHLPLHLLMNCGEVGLLHRPSASSQVRRSCRETQRGWIPPQTSMRPAAVAEALRAVQLNGLAANRSTHLAEAIVVGKRCSTRRTQSTARLYLLLCSARIRPPWKFVLSGSSATARSYSVAAAAWSPGGRARLRDWRGESPVRVKLFGLAHLRDRIVHLLLLEINTARLLCAEAEFGAMRNASRASRSAPSGRLSETSPTARLLCGVS